MNPAAHDAIQSLARITQASSRLAALIALHDKAIDPEEELGHIRANLDHVRRLIEGADR